MRLVFIAALLGGAWAEEAVEAEAEAESALSPEEQAAELIGKFTELKELLKQREDLLGLGDGDESDGAPPLPYLLNPALMKKLGVGLISVLFFGILLLVWFVTRPKAAVEKGKKKK